MKSVILAFVLCINSVSFACDFSTVKKQGEEFVYSKECHKEVGKLLEVEEKRKEQINTLNDSIRLKDLALTESDKRVLLWQEESRAQQKMLQNSNKYSTLNDVLWFAAGASSILLGAWAVKQVK